MEFSGVTGENEEVLRPEVPYLSAIGALMYIANCTRPDIAFAVNLLARYSAVGDSPRGPLKQRGNPHLNPGTETR
jgi:hypothetical protein